MTERVDIGKGGGGGNITVYQTINAQTLDRQTIARAAELMQAEIRYQQTRHGA